MTNNNKESGVLIERHPIITDNITVAFADHNWFEHNVYLSITKDELIILRDKINDFIEKDIVE